MYRIAYCCLKIPIMILFMTGMLVNERFCLLNFVTETQQQQQQGTIITRSTTTLSQARYWFAATSSGEFVFFAGGYNSTGQASDRVDICNVTSGNWTTATLSIPRSALAATSSQNLVFFGGGWNGSFANPIVYDRVDMGLSKKSL
jgi:hypothetical protein